MQILIIKETDKDGTWFIARKKESGEVVAVRRTINELETYLQENKDFIKTFLKWSSYFPCFVFIFAVFLLGCLIGFLLSPVLGKKNSC